MKFFLLIALVAFASAKSAPHILGDEECTQGPAFWCQDYKSAKQCGSVKYCIEHHWKKQLKGTVCDACKAVVTEFHSVLADNMTETEILQALEGVCATLGTYSELCKSLVDTYGNELIHMLLDATKSPEVICSALGLCTSNRKAEFVTMNKKGLVTFGGSKQAQEPKSSALCITCEFAITELDKLLGSKATEEKIIATVKSLCSHLPATIKDECDALISEYGDQIIHLLISKMDPKKICTALELCPPSKIKKVPNEFVKVVKGGIECEACEIVVKYVDSYLKENKTETEIIEALKYVCSELGSYKQTCDSIVSTYLPAIIKLLASMPAEEVCKEIGLCTSNGAKLKINQIRLNKKTIGSNIGGTSCEVCKFVVGYADSLLKQKKTQDEIKLLLEEVCAKLGAYKAECDSLVSTYLPVIINLLESMTPEEVCKEIGLCTSNGAKLKMNQRIKLEKKTIGSKIGGTSCEVCKIVVGYAESLVKQKKTQDEIIELVEKFCATLGAYKDECDSLVTSYLPEILDLLVKEMSPEVVCTAVGLCTSNGAKLKMNQRIKLEKKTIGSKIGGTSCEVCKIVVGYADSLLKQKKTQEEIESFLKTVCGGLGSLKAECDSLVTEFLPTILELLAKEFEPDVVCKKLGLCTGKAELKKITINKIGSKNGGEFCSTCKVLVGYVDTLLKDKKTEDEIKLLVESFCANLGTYKAECDALVNEFLPTILELLAKELDPVAVCTRLGLCTSKTELKKSKLTKEVKGGIQCTLCEAIVSSVSSLLDNKTEAEITAVIEKLCTMFGQYKEECQSLVAAYVPEIIKLLKEEIQNPEILCKNLGLCDALNKLMRKVKSFKAPNEQTKCILCKVLVGYVKAKFKSAITEAEIAKDLEQLCSFLGTYKTMCHSYIENYLPAIIKYITQELDPEAICKEFSLCPTTHKVKMVFLEKSVPLVV